MCGTLRRISGVAKEPGMTAGVYLHGTCAQKWTRVRPYFPLFTCIVFYTLNTTPSLPSSKPRSALGNLLALLFFFFSSFSCSSPHSRSCFSSFYSSSRIRSFGEPKSPMPSHMKLPRALKNAWRPPSLFSHQRRMTSAPLCQKYNRVSARYAPNQK